MTFYTRHRYISIKHEKMSLIRLFSQGVACFSLVFRRRKRRQRDLEQAIRSQAARGAELREINGRLFIKRIGNNHN